MKNPRLVVLGIVAAVVAIIVAAIAIAGAVRASQEQAFVQAVRDQPGDALDDIPDEQLLYSFDSYCGFVRDGRTLVDVLDVRWTGGAGERTNIVALYRAAQEVC